MAVTLPSKVSVGFAVMTLIAPEKLPRPYMALCGPLTTSMRSMSSWAKFTPARPETYAPSTNRATLFSPKICVCVTPRITGVGRSSPKAEKKIRPGVWAATSPMFTMPACSMASAVKAVTASGTSCRRSSAFRAVTTISSSSSTCAAAGDAHSTDAIAAERMVFGCVMAPGLQLFVLSPHSRATAGCKRYSVVYNRGSTQ